VWDLNHPEHITLPHGRHARELAQGNGGTAEGA